MSNEKLEIRYDLGNELFSIIAAQAVAITDYKNGVIHMIRLRATINRLNSDMIIAINRAHERTKKVVHGTNAQGHKDTNAQTRGGPKKEEDDGPRCRITHKRTHAPAHWRTKNKE